jgi:hypothetical protein
MSVCNYVKPDSAFNWERQWPSVRWNKEWLSDWKNKNFSFVCSYPLCHMHLHLDRLFFFYGHFYTCVECVDLKKSTSKRFLRNQVKINPSDAWRESALRLQKRVAPKSTHFPPQFLSCLFLFSIVFHVLSSLFLPSFCWPCLAMHLTCFMPNMLVVVYWTARWITHLGFRRVRFYTP